MRNICWNHKHFTWVFMVPLKMLFPSLSLVSIRIPNFPYQSDFFIPLLWKSQSPVFPSLLQGINMLLYILFFNISKLTLYSQQYFFLMTFGNFLCVFLLFFPLIFSLDIRFSHSVSIFSLSGK